MKLGRHKSFFYSLALHLLLIAALVYFSKSITPLEQTKREVQTVKSYIYQRPKPIEKKQVKETIVKELAEEPKAVVPEQQAVKKETVKEQPTILETTTPIEIKTDVQEPLKDAPASTQTKATFSPYSQLKNLRERINQDISVDDITNFRGATSGSPMHGKPAIVPESKVEETLEEKRERTTQHLSSQLSITKNDNGTCTIVEDLSAVGIEGVKAVSGFRCGESKDQKAFREHMEGVLKKLGKGN